LLRLSVSGANVVGIIGREHLVVSFAEISVDLHSLFKERDGLGEPTAPDPLQALTVRHQGLGGPGDDLGDGIVDILGDETSGDVHGDLDLLGEIVDRGKDLFFVAAERLECLDGIAGLAIVQGHPDDDVLLGLDQAPGGDTIDGPEHLGDPLQVFRSEFPGLPQAQSLEGSPGLERPYGHRFQELYVEQLRQRRSPGFQAFIAGDIVKGENG
jgi:hypothetical protein